VGNAIAPPLSTPTKELLSINKHFQTMKNKYILERTKLEQRATSPFPSTN